MSRAKDNLVLFAEVRQRVKLSRPTIYRKMKAGTFPKSVPISAGLVAWYESDLDRWVSDPMGWSEVSQNDVGV